MALMVILAPGHIHAIRDHPVKRPIIHSERWIVRPRDHPQGLFDGIVWNIGIDPRQGVSQTSDKYNLTVVVTLRSFTVRGNVNTV